VRGCREAGGI